MQHIDCEIARNSYCVRADGLGETVSFEQVDDDGVDSHWHCRVHATKPGIKKNIIIVCDLG